MSMSNETHQDSEQETPVELSNNAPYLNPITYMENENSRLAKLILESCFYFYIYYPKPIPWSNDNGELPPPPLETPLLRRTPSRHTMHVSAPYYVMDENLHQTNHKILCKAKPCLKQISNVECYDVSYLSIYAPPEIILFHNPSKWLPCKWKLYANGDIYYNVEGGLYGPYTGYHYTNYLNKEHNIMRAVLSQLCYAVIKLFRILSRVRKRIRIRLFIQNTHPNSRSILRKLSGSHWTREKILIYQYICPLSDAWRIRWNTVTT